MDFNELFNKILNLKSVENVDSFLIGKSLMGQSVYAFHIGNYDGPQILMDGAIHAREYITTLFLIEKIKYLSDKKLNGGIYFIPLVNPDGVRLVLDGLNWITSEKLKKILLIINNGSDDFKLWKANLNGIDLNVNFNALWGEGKFNKYELSSDNFIGYYPNSEREVKNLINFVFKENPDCVISFHSKGEVIYYGFDELSENSLKRDLFISNKISEINGYKVEKTDQSVGGFTDFVSLNLNIPAITIEVGDDKLKHPILEENLNDIFNKNKAIGENLLNLLIKCDNQFN